MIINKLTCKGFKSFANKTELQFGSGFTIVIGANGAGKSNIMDALCFVLGKSSAKEMRAQNSASLIFNGGKKGSPAKEAEVTIEFDNSKKEFPINHKEVKISRTVKRNGTSTYRINNEVRTRQQILELLNAGKINPDGHNIVLQGDIINFTTMKPVERMEIIEEISGISIYEDKKQKCMNELNKVDARLNETEIILKEREVNLRELKKDRDQALKFKELESNIKDHKATYLHLQIKEKDEKLKEINSKKKEAESKIENIKKITAEIKSKIIDFKEEINKINQEVEIKGEKDQLILRKEIDELRTNIIKVNLRAEVCQNELNKIGSRKEQLNNNIEEINNKIKDLNSDKPKLKQELDRISSSEKDLGNKIKNLKQKHNIDDDIGLKFESLDKNIEFVLGELSKINEEKQNLIRNKDQLEFKLKFIGERLDNLKGSSAELEKLKTDKKESKEIILELNKYLSQDASYLSQLSQARHSLIKNSEEFAKLRARQIGIQEKSLGDMAVRKILGLKRSLKGIYGTVSELGDVDSKYALALEIAAGSRIQSIVVDTDSTAQQCIENLKHNKLGIAAFLPLNKVKSRKQEPVIKSLLKQKGVLGLASDLVKYDKKYNDIFSYVLGSTLIIDSIETGRRIGIGKARMVTIDGDILEQSGAMIGGYRVKRLGLGFKEKTIDENIKKLEKEVEQLKNLITHLENKKTENELNIQKLRERKANLESDIIKTEKILNIGNASELLDDKKKLESEIKELNINLTEFEDKLKLKNKDLETLKEQRQKVKEKLNDPQLAKYLGDLEQEKLKEKEKSLDAENKIKNIEAQIYSMLTPEKEKIEKIIKQHDKEFEDFSKELKDLQEMHKQRNKELKEKEVKESKFHTNLKDLIAKRHKFTEKMQTTENNLVREDEKIKNFEQKLNNILIDRAKAIAETEALHKEFEPLKEAKIKRELTLDVIKLKVNEYEKELNKIGNVNLRSLEVYDEIQKEYEKVTEKVIKVKTEKEDILLMLNEIESKKKDIFLKTFNEISKKFVEIHSQISTKGEALMYLEDPENPLEAGIDIKIKMARNKFLDMKALSGGEKTLTALALIFAIQEHSPSPFYLLDEVDAALDKRNSEMLSRYVQKYSNKAQYIVISHNDQVITEAEYVYGVSMQEGITKVISLRV